MTAAPSAEVDVARRCQLCDGPIGAERMQALPRATTCITCASLRKRASRGRTCS